MQIQHVTELARLASDLGGNLVRIFTGYDNPARKYGEQWNLIVLLCGNAHNGPRTSASSSECRITTTSASAIRRITTSSARLIIRNCRAMFDAWAPALQGADIVAAARAMGPVTVQTTVADYVLRPRYKYNPAIVNYFAETPAVQAVPMGQGIIRLSWLSFRTDVRRLLRTRSVRNVFTAS